MPDIVTGVDLWVLSLLPPHREKQAVYVHEPFARQWATRAELASFQRLVTIRNRLDLLSPAEVDWTPFGRDAYLQVPRTLMCVGFLWYHDIIEPYAADKCVRQFGKVQKIPRNMPPPLRVCRAEDPRRYSLDYGMINFAYNWRFFPDSGCLNLAKYADHSLDLMTSADYLAWFGEHSHQYVVNERDALPLQRPDHTTAKLWLCLLSQQGRVLYNDKLEQVQDEEFRTVLLQLRETVKRMDTVLGFRRVTD